MKLAKKLQECDWKTFEQLIGEVLELHDYKTYWNINVTINKKRRQYDLVANKYSNTLLIECKKWDNKKTKVSALKNAVLKHKERCSFYGKLFQKKITPVLITFNEEPIIEHEGVFIVSLHRLNDFILKI